MAKGDMFLSLDTAKAGLIKGEADDTVHGGEIEISGWSWGMQYPEELRSGGRTGRASLRALCVSKATDSASTGLMATMYTNDRIKKAVLSVRKSSGAKAIDYFVITLKDAFITRFEIEYSDAPVPGMVERIELRFAAIDVTYAPQSDKGQKAGSTSWNAEIANV